MSSSIAIPRDIGIAVVDRAAKSVVLLKGVTTTGTVLGSGFVLSPDGKIATNLHVIWEMISGGVQLASGEIFDAFTVLPAAPPRGT